VYLKIQIFLFQIFMWYSLHPIRPARSRMHSRYRQQYGRMECRSSSLYPDNLRASVYRTTKWINRLH